MTWAGRGQGSFQPFFHTRHSDPPCSDIQRTRRDRWPRIPASLTHDTQAKADAGGYCLRSRDTSGGRDSRSTFASRRAPSRPRPCPPLSCMRLLPLAPTVPSSSTRPSRDTWKHAAQRAASYTSPLSLPSMLAGWRTSLGGCLSPRAFSTETPPPPPIQTSTQRDAGLRIRVCRRAGPGVSQRQPGLRDRHMAEELWQAPAARRRSLCCQNGEDPQEGPV